MSNVDELYFRCQVSNAPGREPVSGTQSFFVRDGGLAMGEKYDIARFMVFE